MKNIKKISFVFFSLILILSPLLIFAQDKPLVPCTNDCDFDKLLELVNKVLHYVVIGLAVPIMAIMFCYAGFLMLTSGGEASQKTKAKKIFGSVAIGFIIAAAAFIIVKFILNLLGYNGAWIGF